MSIIFTIYSGRCHAYQIDDELVFIGGKTLNVSELRRILKRFAGCGEVSMSVQDGMIQGELSDE